MARKKGKSEYQENIGATIHPCAFDILLSKSVPHIFETIFFSLDYGSYKKCCWVNSSWKKLIASKPFQKRAKSIFHQGMLRDEKKLLRYSVDGKAEEVDILLSIGINPNTQIGDRFECLYKNKTLLYLATTRGHKDVAKLLLDAGADPNKATNDPESPLSWATKRGDIDIMKLLLAAGADPNTPGLFRKTPLYWAANGHIDVVKLLLNNGANPNIAADYSGQTPLINAVQFGLPEEHVKILLDAGADPNKAKGNGETPLYWATRKGNTNVVKLLLDAGGDPNKAKSYE